MYSTLATNWLEGKHFNRGRHTVEPNSALTHTKCPRTVKNKSPLWHLQRAAASFQIHCGVVTIPAAGEALKGPLGGQEAFTSALHLDCLNNWAHKIETHLIEWMWEDNQHNQTNGVLKQCQMMSPGSRLDRCHRGGLVLSCFCRLFMRRFEPLLSTIFSIWKPSHTRLWRCCEWKSFNSDYLDGSPLQFFKTHFTYTTDAIKEPRRKISIEECLYSASIVHLLWQTSKSKISALSSCMPWDVVIKHVGSQSVFSAERKVLDNYVAY